MSNLERYLISMARTVLAANFGEGYWKPSRPDGPPPLEECVTGVEVGDTLWKFDEDDSIPVSGRVAHVDEQGRAWHTWPHRTVVKVSPMWKCQWFHTAEECAKDWVAREGVPDNSMFEVLIRNAKETARLAGVSEEGKQDA